MTAATEAPIALPPTAGAASAVRPETGYLLTRVPPGRMQLRLALVMAGLSVLIVAATAPFARQMLPGTEGLLPAYAAVLFIVELITAALLFGHFSNDPAPCLLVLATGYLFAAALVPGWALTFPGVFGAFGLDAVTQGTAYIAAASRLGFPLFVLGYALLKRAPHLSPAAASRLIGAAVTGSVGFALAFSWFVVAHDSELPRLMQDARVVSALWNGVPIAALAIYAVTLAALWLRRSSSLDMWLIVVVCTLIIELTLLSFLGGGLRLSLAWWVGRIFGVASASAVLIALLIETIRLYDRLARSVAAERKAREGRLVAMEAMSASLAHEITQPISSMVTNADAAVRWLDRPEPDLAEVRAALGRIARDGHRAGGVVSGIRTMFLKGAQERRLIDMQELVADVVARSQGDARLARVAVVAETGRRTMTVSGSLVQLHQVVTNLIANAIEAAAGAAPPREVRVTIGAAARDGVLVSVIDSGPGVPEAERERVFEPFYTTKANGMGMGLMFSRSIVEAHGGKLWVEDAPRGGAAFRLVLPRLAAAPRGAA